MFDLPQRNRHSLKRWHVNTAIICVYSLLVRATETSSVCLITVNRIPALITPASRIEAQSNFKIYALLFITSGTIARQHEMLALRSVKISPTSFVLLGTWNHIRKLRGHASMAQLSDTRGVLACAYHLVYLNDRMALGTSCSHFSVVTNFTCLVPRT